MNFIINYLKNLTNTNEFWMVLIVICVGVLMMFNKKPVKKDPLEKINDTLKDTNKTLSDQLHRIADEIKHK
ncbi:hypothetical protein [Paraclostridium sordellii]|uniref:hypothetical protein n=1 Tax=Paraclostridium sordellii TaxID=1505 RepID=UPI0003869ECE|nr:hypothetical protein [Paeniclostridium sordellii]EPZ61892.1 hypothetical protein H476_3517 [[Clostridium] sordellii VPI 9048] [Paeniclostridium sordellii VPI 9048]CEN26615.1 Uncharacterised protein [[Clostridium] sordellii] [Paeniclostridium sordellii]CEP50436.1 Uncharacterised protein [[Clostridium] sordellii] [Paeniclostridium sordellii]